MTEEERPPREMLDDAEWLTAQLETKTPTEIAQLIFCPPGAVLRAMRKAGVTEPDRDNPA